VPVFVHGRAAWAEGVGERLTPVALAGAQYLVVKPAAAVATRDVFAHPLARRDSEPDILAGSFEDSAACRSGYGRNDLQPAAEDGRT
jgi:4-diphosphocytidyl-2-C-methyl-D-erythritol kinase